MARPKKTELFHELVKLNREKNNMTRKDLAIKLAVSEPAVYALESGKYTFASARIVLDIQEVFGMSDKAVMDALRASMAHPDTRPADNRGERSTKKKTTKKKTTKKATAKKKKAAKKSPAAVAA